MLRVGLNNILFILGFSLALSHTIYEQNRKQRKFNLKVQFISEIGMNNGFINF